MSLLGWFSRKSADEDLPSTTLRDSTRPPVLTSSRKVERNARRERLYGVVREAMVNGGVLSSAYRFKVLSLDGRGRQFLVMVDLVGEHAGSTAELARIETAMVQAAKAQHGIVLKAVYWREAAGSAAAKDGSAETHVPVAAPASATPAKAERVAPAAVQAPQPAPQDKVSALHEALAAGDARPHAKSFDGATVQGPQSYTLLTGFEDTELGVPATAPGAAKKTAQR